MAKSFKDVVQDSPRTGLGIPVTTKKPLSRTSLIRSPGTSIRGHTPVGQIDQGRNKRIPSPNDARSQVHPRRRTAGAGPDVFYTGPQYHHIRVTDGYQIGFFENTYQLSKSRKLRKIYHIPHFSCDRIFLWQITLCRDETFTRILGKPCWTIQMHTRNIAYLENIYKSKNLSGTHLTQQLFTYRWCTCNAVSILSIYIQLHYTISFNKRQINSDSMQYFRS